MARSFLRMFAFLFAVSLATAKMPTLEFTANLILYYKEGAGAAPSDAACKSGGCENAINDLLMPWVEWAMEEMGHDPKHYKCDDFDDYEDCPRYPIFEGDKNLRYCTRCKFSGGDYTDITDVSQLINTTILKWVQTHTIDGVRRVLDPIDEQVQGCPCLGLKYKYMIDYYVSEEGQRRRERKFMRI